MFSRSLALVNGADPAQSARLIDSPRLAPGSSGSKPYSVHSNLCAAAVAAELAALTRLFKRLMRSRSRAAVATPPSSKPSTATAATAMRCRQAATSTQTGAHGQERIPAMLRKNCHPRRMSPAQVGEPTRSVAAPSPRVHTDPIDPRRVVISGNFAEVCAALDRLVARQDASSSQSG